MKRGMRKPVLLTMLTMVMATMVDAQPLYHSERLKQLSIIDLGTLGGAISSAAAINAAGRS